MAYNPKLKINLIEIFNRVFSSKPYEVRRTLREVVYRNSFQEDFGSLAIDKIVDRTLSGKDKNGDSFAGYSPSYKKSLAFEIYKGSKTKVDLKLTGEMLASMEAKASSGGVLTIQFVDSENAAKAHGHITGMSGRKGGKVRDFFGLSDTEADEIMRTVMRGYQGEIGAIEGSFKLIGQFGNQEILIDQNLREVLL